VTSQAKPGMLHRVQETENWALRSEPITTHSRAHQEPEQGRQKVDSENETFESHLPDTKPIH